MNIKEQYGKAKAKFKFYFSLNHEFASLKRDVDLLVNRPPWLPLFNQDKFRLVEKLQNERLTKNYKLAFSKKNPLVSVRIATYNNADELFDRAIPSVLKQTYKNWEIVIVGDYCTDDTEQRIRELNHPRITFQDLSYHYPYPENQIQRWMAQGALVHNRAVELCKGDWIAPLDDDNEFLPYHIEMLLDKARSEKLELVYGNMISVDRDNGETRKVGGFPPQVGNFDFSAALYHSVLKIFPFDINSYLYSEVVDTNLIRRFREAGIRIGFLNRYVTRYFFRQPGSPRSSIQYPEKKGLYNIYCEMDSKKGALIISSAETLFDGIVSCKDLIVVVGNSNKWISSFVNKIFEKGICKKGCRLVFLKNDSKFPRNLTNIEFLILNTGFNKRNFKEIYEKLNKKVQIGGLVYTVSKEIVNDLLGSGLMFIENGLFMKI